jgi:hypothetical protein
MSEAIMNEVEQIVRGAIIDCEVDYNEESGNIVINEWHSDCEPPFYVVPAREAIKFAKWLVQTRIQQQRQARRVSEMLFTPEDKARMRAANRKWDAEQAAREAAKGTVVIAGERLNEKGEIAAELSPWQHGHHIDSLAR